MPAFTNVQALHFEPSFSHAPLHALASPEARAKLHSLARAYLHPPRVIEPGPLKHNNCLGEAQE